MRDGATGHYEVLVPTIARMEGFSIADLASDRYKLVAWDQFSAPARVEKTGGLTVTRGIPFVHPVKDAASLQRLITPPDAPTLPSIRITERTLSSFPRVHSWEELLESKGDCILSLPRQALPSPLPVRDWYSGDPDYRGRSPQTWRDVGKAKPMPLNDLHPEQACCLCLHNAVIVVPDANRTPRPAMAKGRVPWREKHLLLTSRNEIISDSFFRYQRLSQTFAVDETGTGTIPAENLVAPLEVTMPTLFGDVIAGHFGHMLLEGLARYWPLNRTETLDADTLLFAAVGIIGAQRFRNEIPDWIQELLQACGIPAEHLHLTQRTTRFRKLLVPKRISGHITDYGLESDLLMRNIGCNIASGLNHGSPRARIYLSRSRLHPDKRQLPPEQEIALDAIFSRLGYEIIHPQELPISEQIARVRGATRIAGCAGSQMALLQFCAAPAPPVFMIAGAHNPAWILAILAAKGSRIDLFVVPQEHVDPSIPISKTPWELEPSHLERLEESLVRWEQEVPTGGCSRLT